MITNKDIENIENFEKLKPNTQRVFKHRLIKKCKRSFQNMEFILSKYNKLGIRIENVVDIVQLAKILELYSKLNLLQNM